MVHLFTPGRCETSAKFSSFMRNLLFPTTLWKARKFRKGKSLNLSQKRRSIAWGIQTYLNVAISIHFNQFTNFSFSYWGIMGKGIHPTTQLQNGMRQWILMPAAFKLDHLQPFQPILFWKISNFSLSYWGSHYLLPQRANNGEREFTQL